MSKRSAQGPQGSKDDEHIFEMSSTPNEAPQRATAAQMASRKIKDIRRRPRGTTPTGGGAAEQPSNAFGGISTPSFSNPAPSFGAAPAQSGGFNFGQSQSQSQSFPGASSAPSQPAQSGSTPFSFGGGGVGGGQTGFNFGASSGGFGSTTFNNPFASDAGNSKPAPSTQNNSFTSFGFGNQTTSQPAQPSQPAFSFGAPQSTNTPTSSGMFGQSSTANPSASPADSMQMSPDAKPKTSASTTSSFQSRNLFGDSAPNLFSPKPAATAGNPFSNLNGASSADKPASEKADGFAAKPMFGAQQTPTSNQTPQFGSIFGAPATVPKPSESEKPASTNLFGAGSSQPTFAGLSATKPADEQATPNNLFAPKPAANQKADTPADANPFKNLFGGAPTNQSFSGSQAQAAPAPAAQNPFAPKPPAEQTPEKPAEAQPFKNLFGGAVTSSTPGSSGPQQTTSTPAAPTNLFSPKPALDQSADKPADATPIKSLFGATAGTPKPAEAAKEQQTPAQSLFTPKPNAEQPTTNLFASKSTTGQASEKPANANPFGSLFGASASKPNSSESEPAKTQSSPASNIFASSPAKPQTSTQPAKPLGGMFGAKPDTTPGASAVPAPSTSSPSFPTAKPTAAPQIPKSSFTENVDKGNSELRMKLLLLDTIFKEELSTYQPGVDGFDSLIIHYMGIRQAIGAPVGSKTDWKTMGAAPMANGQVTKDSAIPNGVNDSATSSVFAKSFSSPTKPIDSTNAASSPFKPNSTSSLTPATKQPENLFAAPNTANPDQSSKPAENPFAKISTTAAGKVSEPTPQVSENPFAKIATTTQAASSTPAAKGSEPPKMAGNMFASPQSSNAQSSAAPLSMPKFGNGTGGVDFMAQFKKKAEETEAKEKAKRKAEDFDSDEDDEEEWERKDAELQREKRAKMEAASKKKAVFVPGKGFQFVDADEESQDDSKKLALPAPSPASPAPSSGSIFESSSQPVPASQNIFGRISSTTPQPAGDDNDSDASDDAKPKSSKRSASANVNGDVDDAKADEHTSKRSKATQNGDTGKSSLDTPIPEPTAAAGRSLFDRIDSPTPSFASPKPASNGINFGASTTSNSGNPFASLGAKSQTSQLFGASFGSPQPASASSPAATDNTWKPSTPIKFATDTNSTSAQASTEASAQTSGAENATSGAATPDEEGAPGSFFDMSSGNAGEEEETVEYECRARAFKLNTSWASQGTGVVRLLKHPGTGRARIILRAEPSGNIILNALLKKELDYAKTTNSVQFMVPQVDGKPEQWAIRVKPESIEAFHQKLQAIKN